MLVLTVICSKLWAIVFKVLMLFSRCILHEDRNHLDLHPHWYFIAWPFSHIWMIISFCLSLRSGSMICFIKTAESSLVMPWLIFRKKSIVIVISLNLVMNLWKINSINLLRHTKRFLQSFGDLHFEYETLQDSLIN